MNKYGLLASVGRTGVCYDNAAAESFNATCKKELVNRKIYHTRRKAIKEVTSWIELCYNQTGVLWVLWTLLKNGISRLLSGVGSILGGRGWGFGTLTPSEVVSDCSSCSIQAVTSFIACFRVG